MCDKEVILLRNGSEEKISMGQRKSKIVLTQRKKDLYFENSKIIQFWRRNPVIATKDLLGIQLMDSQKVVLINSWNTKYNCWTASRDWGKSFLLAVMAALKKLLYPNQRIYLISS